jgi:hypothetical protein
LLVLLFLYWRSTAPTRRFDGFLMTNYSIG